MPKTTPKKRGKPQPKPSQMTAEKPARPNSSHAKHSPKEKRQMAEPTNAKGEKTSPAATQAPATVAAGERSQASIRYLDQADITETFADSITGLIFDGQTLRIEFGVTRFDEVKPNTQITGRRYPACRLVLPPAAAVELINRMQQIANALTQAGVVKATPRPAAPEPAKS
jgi:hypothetical protein